MGFIIKSSSKSIRFLKENFLNLDKVHTRSTAETAVLNLVQVQKWSFD